MNPVNELSQFTFTLTNEVNGRNWICEKRRKKRPNPSVPSDPLVKIYLNSTLKGFQ